MKVQPDKATTVYQRLLNAQTIDTAWLKTDANRWKTLLSLEQANSTIKERRMIRMALNTCKQAAIWVDLPHLCIPIYGFY